MSDFKKPENNHSTIVISSSIIDMIERRAECSYLDQTARTILHLKPGAGFMMFDDLEEVLVQVPLEFKDQVTEFVNNLIREKREAEEQLKANAEKYNQARDLISELYQSGFIETYKLSLSQMGMRAWREVCLEAWLEGRTVISATSAITPE